MSDNDRPGRKEQESSREFRRAPIIEKLGYQPKPDGTVHKGESPKPPSGGSAIESPSDRTPVESKK